MPTRERWDALLAQGYADAEAALPLLLERGFTEKPTEAAASSERAVPLPGTARGRSRSRSRSAKPQPQPQPQPQREKNRLRQLLT